MAKKASTESTDQAPTPSQQRQLLTWVGDAPALESALEAGERGVCFGLTTLSPERRARNFRPDEFAQVVQQAHAHQARACLGLHLDLSDRELGQAARTLQLARESGADAVLIRDPALLALRPESPEVEFHFGPNACMASSADFAAAARLGVSRVMPIREMTPAEVSAASASTGMPTATFDHEEACTSIAGRCLLSSWIGGSGAGRGVCSGVCRQSGKEGTEPDDASAEEEEGPVQDELFGEVNESGEMELPAGPTYDLEITVGQQVVCRCQCGGHTVQWTIPKTVVRRRAISIGHLFEQLARQTIQGHRLDRATTNDPEFLLVPRAGNAMIDRISAVVHKAKKAPEEQLHVDLSASIRAILEKPKPSGTNRRRLGQRPDRVRLDASAAATFFRAVQPESAVIEGVTPGSLERVLAAADETPIVVALPSIFFEDDVPLMRQLLERCADARVTVEVNNWGGWQLASEAGVSMESGPGLPVLNALAARALADHGIRGVTLSVEADRRLLEELTGICPVPCSLIVFSRPVLRMNRMRPEERHGAEKLNLQRDGVRMMIRRERNLWVSRPEEPMDLRNTVNEGIRASHLVVDLVGAEEPVDDWRDIPLAKRKTFRFNYDRA